MGTGYKGGASYYHNISENMSALQSAYSYSNGYFGTPGRGGVYTRNISSDNPSETANNFYNIAAHGGIEHSMENGKGVTTKMADGTVISYREISSSDRSPAVEINIRKSDNDGGLKYQKIHFTKRGAS